MKNFFFGMIFGGLLVFGGYFFQNQQEKAIDFNSCVEQGNPIMESYPRQCRTPDGELFIEEIEDLEPETPINNNESQIFCSPEEKAAEMCTMEYMPVCGSDGQTYGNKCGACSQGVDYYTSGECEDTNTTFNCPQIAPPSPDFCQNGTIEDGGLDQNGCQLPPLCRE